LASIPQQIAQIDVGIQKIRLKFERALAGRDGFIQLALLPERVAQIVVGLRVVGLECDRPAIRRNGFVQPASRAPDYAEVRVSHRIIRVDNDGFANPLQGGVMASPLKRDDTEKMQRAGVVGLRRKDAPIKRLRLRQPPRALVLHRDLQRFRNRHATRMNAPRSSATPQSRNAQRASAFTSSRSALRIEAGASTVLA